MTTTTQHAIDLMPQLRDILGLPANLDLPRLYRITMTAHDAEPGWTVDAMLRTGSGVTDLDQWNGLLAWAPGATPKLSDPSPSSITPSGMFRKASVTVSVAEVTVEIWVHLDGLFVAPEPVRVTGAFADFLLGEEPQPAPFESTYSDPAVRNAIRDTLGGAR